MANIHICMKVPIISNVTRPRQTHSCKMWTSPIVLLVFISNFHIVLSTIYVINDTNNQTVKVVEDEPARFIPAQDTFYDIKGYVVYAEPSNACTKVKPPPEVPYPAHWILLARRYDCDFQTKIENAQNASYYAIIVHNVGTNTTPTISVKDDSKINIFAVFIGEYDGMLLRDNYQYSQGYHVRIQDDFSFNGYILPFAIVVGVCFVTMFLFLVRLLWQQGIRWVRERRRNRKRRLPTSALKKLPTQKFVTSDPYETCAICIEDFVLHDKIRVLPCSHGFHTDCIDPWLTKGRRVCPICKRKVVLAEERFSESDSDSDSENAPLLGTSSTRGTFGASTSATQPPTTMGGSTFVQQRENPFRRAHNRMRERAQERSVLIQNSDSSTSENEDDDDYESSSDPSHSNHSYSHSRNSIVAEVHSSTNMSSHPDPICPQGMTTLIPFSSSSSHHQSKALCDSSVILAKEVDGEHKQQQQKKEHCKKSQEPFDSVCTDSATPITVTPDCNDNSKKGNHHSAISPDHDDSVVDSVSVVVSTPSNKNPNISQEFGDLPNPADSSSSSAHHESSNSMNLLQTQHPKSNAIV